VRVLRGCGTRSPARTRAWPMMRDRQGGGGMETPGEVCVLVHQGRS
jgi:hypothetical protein